MWIGDYNDLFNLILFFSFIYGIGDWYSGFVIEFDIEFDEEWVRNRKDESRVF